MFSSGPAVVTSECHVVFTVHFWTLLFRVELERSDTGSRLDWIRLESGNITEELRVPSDHLESLFFSSVSTEITAM